VAAGQQEWWEAWQVQAERAQSERAQLVPAL